MAAGADEVGLSDTSGYADPASVKRLIKVVRGAVGEAAVTGLHLHNTRGLGLANALAGQDLGITTLDASLGGLGPARSRRAPAATSFEAMGLDTSIDLDRLLRIREIVKAAVPAEEMYGFTPDARLRSGGPRLTTPFRQLASRPQRNQR